MIIQAIKQSGKEKLLAIARRKLGKNVGSTTLCDWNTVPGSLRIFWDDNDPHVFDFAGDFKRAVKFIWSL